MSERHANPLPPVRLTATFTLTFSVERDRWVLENGVPVEYVADDFWAYLGAGDQLAEQLRAGMGALRDAEGTVTMTSQARSVARRLPDGEIPAEPPVGTEFLRAGQVLWTRHEDGWHCTDDGCRNCPADWSEVWDIGNIRDAVVRP